MIPGLSNVTGIESIDKVILIDQVPIGRTPRSNPATYLGISDKIRDLFAKTNEAQLAGFGKSRFSFNNAGGRCETCLGAGRVQIGMHFLGIVDIVCPECNGLRFNMETLGILYKGLSISEVYELSVEQALTFFNDQKLLLKQLKSLNDIGLGYLRLGQASTTLSGGEAQRIKLAYELQKSETGNTLYIFDEPTTGLHSSDISVLLHALRELTKKGNTIVCIEHDAQIIRNADWIVDLGPGSGEKGGELVFMGPYQAFTHCQNSITARFLDEEKQALPLLTRHPDKNMDDIVLQGVTTHQLKDISVAIPREKLTVITGVSGSGKSSLAFDTLFAESQSRFTESLSTYARSMLKQSNPAQLVTASGIGPVVAIGRKYLSYSSRSTMGTITGLYDHYRLLFSRISQLNGFEFTAQHFSFNHQLGACPSCDGLGYQLVCDPDRLISHPERSILDGAMNGHKAGKFYGDPYGQYLATLSAVASRHGFDLSEPWNKLNTEAKELILYGTGEEVWEVIWNYKNKTLSGTHSLSAKWMGFCNLVEDEYSRKHLNKNTRDVEDLMKADLCLACHGNRLKPELLAVQVAGLNIAKLSELTVSESIVFFEEAMVLMPETAENAVIVEIGLPVLRLLQVIEDLGLGYLTTNRSSSTLSGGEGQRLRIAGAFSSKLFGVTYILDEPTIGLHQIDTKPLISILKKLVTEGNTVVVVEHDETIVREADYIIEMGPGAGEDGGRIVASGSLQDILKSNQTLTAKLLNRQTEYGLKNRQLKNNAFGIRHAGKNNLKNIDVDFISGGIIAVTGISGSGKSSLVREVLWKSWDNKRATGCSSVYGLSGFSDIIYIDQQPVADNSLSTPATFTGLMDLLRDLFAMTNQAKILKLSKAAFSYLNKEGKCPDCNGYGIKRTSMDFMSDVWTPCDSCNGSRYQELPNQCLYQEKSIGEVLNLTVDQAIVFLRKEMKILSFLNTLNAVGLGHIRLGQPGNTLSGGESQRLKLATLLIKHHKGRTLYLLDEPATGLHYFDIEKLITVFDKLADDGNTVLFIEHNPALIAIANQVIELGPGSGPSGGEICRS